MFLKYIDSKKFFKLPISLIILINIIAYIGFIVLYSASNLNIYPWAYKQIIIFSIFFPLSILISLLNIKIIFRYAYIFYFTILILLFSIELFGYVAMGAKRWLNLGFMRIQPSEMAKLAIILMLSRYFHELSYEDFKKIHKIILPIIGVAIPSLLIIKQPDLGTAIICILVSIIIFFIIGFKIKNFIIMGLIALFCMPIGWNMMHEYQKKRVEIFLNPEKDPLGAGYNIIQSKIAIGSGGIFGKGLSGGTQSHLDFLPEHQTDFIFATFVEEFGFIGGVVLLILYGAIVIISLTIAINSKSIFGKLLVVGIISIFFSHVIINIFMVLGLLPVVGIPLPLVSFGGTIMASMLLGFGLIMNVSIYRNVKL
jgi:rod shape determining protein RodA